MLIDDKLSVASLHVRQHMVMAIDAGPAEPVRSVRPWPDQLFGNIIKFLFLPGIFQGLRTSEAFY